MNNEAMESNRLELRDPEEWEAPPLTREDEDDLWEEEFERELEYKIGLYGPKPGRWETEWN